MVTFAKFWRARDRLQWSVTETPKQTETVLRVQAEESVIGLTFEFQRAVASVNGGATMFPDNRHVVLPDLVPGHSVSIHISYLQ